MSTAHKGNHALNVVICFLLVNFWLLFASIGFAQDSSVDPSPMGTVLSGPVMIVWKSKDAISTENERILLVTEKTTILNEKGIIIGLDELPVPCEASLEYRFGREGHPVCLNIVVEASK